jgi:predicted nuclease with RNAse H fold
MPTQPTPALKAAGQVGAPTSVGIDVAEARKGLDLVALDSRRAIVLSHGRLSVDDVVKTVLAVRPAVVCIDSPSGWSRSGSSRLAERQLAQLGIQSYRTGADPGDHPFYGWIRVGLQIFDRLSETYPLYRGGELAGHARRDLPPRVGRPPRRSPTSSSRKGGLPT